ncbi:MAG TPA: PrsW family glutamic-type intramembrane protease [Candidatus Paceibacterota bacterium]|nr:PrsW family glutamic-type intramembrane protease [Candidatus Paceibacterota bacterium]
MSWFFILLAIAGGFLPTIFWLWFWLQEDKKKPEPLRLIMKTFIVGGFFIIIAFILEKFLASGNNIIELVSNAYQSKATLWSLVVVSTPLIIWAVIEEFTKYLAARVAALKNKQCDEPIDVMIYMITAALGFSAVENFLFLLNILSINTVPFNSLFLTGNLRFLGATLLHVVASAVFGAFLSFAFYQNKIIKTIAWILGLITATALHVLFNFFIIVNEEGNVFKVLIGIWAVAIFIIFIFEVIKRIHIKINY